jgi:hypothetical protein
MSKRRDGIHTLADYRGRFRIDDLTGCWHWPHARANNEPYLWLPVLGRRTTLGVAICVLTTGKTPEPGVYWHVTCETPHCGNPRHRKPGTRSEQMLAAKLHRNALSRAKSAAGRAYTSRVSLEAANAIRCSTEPLRVIAERHGISVQYACDIRNGKKRRPMGATGSSAFTWRPTP